MAKERLDKILANRGNLSRKEGRVLIWQGGVTVNGLVVKQPDYKVDTQQDRVTLQGEELLIQEHLYLMLHKPQGVVSATEDSRFPTVVDLVPEKLRRKGLFPAGRLDKDTEGFVLLTDDGAFAHRILAPKNHLPKRYLAHLDHPLDDGLMEEFAKGVRLSEEDRCSPALLTILENGANPRVEVTIHEGMYHQIKRMFERFGYRVIYLKRLQIGGLPLDPALPLGECRMLTGEELAAVTKGYLD